MKRVPLSAVLLGLGGLFTGCDQTDKATTETKVSTPNGTDTKKVTVEEHKTGDQKDNAPAPAAKP